MESGFLNRKCRAGDDRRYGIYVPVDYEPTRPWPVILFLHGAGEGGCDGLLMTEYQLGSAIRRNAASYPALVVFPQCRSKQWVWSSADVDHAIEVLDLVRDEFAVDGQRVYVTGVSTGAKAAWHALYRHPHMFAAGLIVAGAVRPMAHDGGRVADPDPIVPGEDAHPHRVLARRLASMPVWVFHGDDDPVFDVRDAREITACLEAVGAPVRYTELPGFGHDVWDVAYYSEDVANWLLTQARVEQ
ncbi:MAG: alpha/beta hydrolase-fold protein [Actinomycetales bacterium]